MASASSDSDSSSSGSTSRSSQWSGSVRWSVRRTRGHNEHGDGSSRSSQPQRHVERIEGRSKISGTEEDVKRRIQALPGAVTKRHSGQRSAADSHHPALSRPQRHDHGSRHHQGASAAASSRQSVASFATSSAQSQTSDLNSYFAESTRRAQRGKVEQQQWLEQMWRQQQSEESQKRAAVRDRGRVEQQSGIAPWSPGYPRAPRELPEPVTLRSADLSVPYAGRGIYPAAGAVGFSDSHSVAGSAGSVPNYRRRYQAKSTHMPSQPWTSRAWGS